VSSNERRIFWTANPQFTYRLEYKDDLSSATWHVFENSVSWNGNTASMSDWPNNPNSPRFYRVVRLP
jgi:hypothetical protein